jgi:ankyrin repeat protein
VEKLFQAITNKDMTRIMSYLNSGVDVNIKSKDYGNTPLILACYRGYLELVTILLDDPEIDVNIKNDKQETALYVVCNLKNGRDFADRDILKLLLTHPNSKDKINVNSLNLDSDSYDTYITPLQVACIKYNTFAVESLLEHPNININIKDKYQRSALFYACDSYSSKLEIVSLLLNRPEISVDTKSNLNNSCQNTLLTTAISHSVKGIPELLLTHPNSKDNLNVSEIRADGETALSLTSVFGNLEIMNLILDHPKFMYLESGNFMLNLVSNPAKFGVLRLLLTHPNSRNKININYISNLHDTYGLSLLEISLIKDNTPVFRLLLKHPNIKVSHELSVKLLTIATNRRDTDALKSILDFGIDINTPINPKNENETILHMSCHIRSTKVVNFLVNKKSIDINLKDSYGFTPLHIAINNSYIDIVILLLTNPRTNIDITDTFNNNMLETNLFKYIDDIDEVRAYTYWERKEEYKKLIEVLVKKHPFKKTTKRVLLKFRMENYLDQDLKEIHEVISQINNEKIDKINKIKDVLNSIEE